MTEIELIGTLYKQDVAGNTRVWEIYVGGDSYRTSAGILDGNLVESEWHLCEGKNIGKKNETSPHNQAIKEATALVALKLRVDYYKDVEDIGTPKIFKPMLANSWDKRKSKIQYNNDTYYQPKLDGVRCIATRFGLWTRTGKPIVSVPHIIDMLRPIFANAPDTIIDGELYNHELKDDFNAIVSFVKKEKPTQAQIDEVKGAIQYHIYDCPSIGESPYAIRHGALLDIAAKVGDDTIQVIPNHLVHSEVEIDSLNEQYVLAGYEGGIIRIDGPYQQKRSNLLLKRKDFDEEEFIVVAIEAGTGNWAGCAKRVIYQNDLNSNTFGTGISGTRSAMRKILLAADDYIGKEGTVRFFKRTPGELKPRIGVTKALHLTPRF